MTLRKVSARLMAAVGLAAASAAPVAAQSVAPAQAPEAWSVYAEMLSRSVSTWLEDDSAPSLTARTYLDEAQAGEARPLELKVWVAMDGRIDRIDFPPFAHAEVNTALKEALVGRELKGPPPAGMLQPLRIAIQPGN